jgi:hypothetical protein
MKEQVARAALEIGFIAFLFYSNLLMGEYTRAGQAHTRGLLWALQDIFTPANFTICLLAGIVGYVVVEILRRKLP